MEAETLACRICGSAFDPRMWAVLSHDSDVFAMKWGFGVVLRQMGKSELSKEHIEPGVSERESHIESDTERERWRERGREPWQERVVGVRVREL